MPKLCRICINTFATGSRIKFGLGLCKLRDLLTYNKRSDSLYDLFINVNDPNMHTLTFSRSLKDDLMIAIVCTQYT